MNVSYSVLNTIAASAADISLTNGILKIVGTVSSNFPEMEYSTISTQGILGDLVETATVKTVTYTAANSTAYKFSISQTVNGKVETALINYTSDASGTDAEIAAALVAIVNAHQNIHVTASGSASPITLTADSGYPLFLCGAVSNVTIASGMATKAPHATAGTAIAGTTTVTVTTAAAHSLAVGNTVTIADVATMTLTQNGVSGLSGVTARIATVPSSTTFTLEGVTASGTNSGTITITVVAQGARGQGADLITAGISDATSGKKYTTVELNFANTVNPLMGEIARKKAQKHTIYIDQDATNFAAFKLGLTNALSGYTINAGVASTTYNPDTVDKI